MDILGIIAALLFIFFFLYSIKSIMEKNPIFVLYTILSSIFFAVIIFVFMAICGE